MSVFVQLLEDASQGVGRYLPIWFANPDIAEVQEIMQFPEAAIKEVTSFLEGRYRRNLSKLNVKWFP